MREIGWLTWIGAVLLAGCGLPQLLRSFRDPGSTRGLSWWFLGAWWLGDVAFGIGMWPAMSWHGRANYTANAVIISYVSIVKFWYAKKRK